MSTTDPICIVGAGPRGLSVLERLHAAARGSAGETVAHLVDPLVAVGGAVWRTDQPSELLMNTVSAQITMFVDDSVTCEGPVVPGPSLHTWAGAVARGEIDGGGTIPAAVREECAGLCADCYPTRACYGHYLRWVQEELLASLPPGLTVRRHATTATAVRDEADGTQTVTLADGTVLEGLGAVVLAQGHLPADTTPAEDTLAAAARRAGLAHVPPGNPADADLSGIAPGSTVAVRGLGLTFFDHMALLTEGRGGRFVRDDDGELRYRPSGDEPHLVVGSRRGVPYHARGENQKGAFGRHRPEFLTPWVIAGLRRRADNGRPADFGAEVWPLIDREVRSVYYTALVRGSGGDAEAFRAQYRAVADIRAVAPEEAHPLAIDDDDAECALLARWGIDDADRWRWGPIAAPRCGRRFEGPEDHRDWLLDLLRADVAEARRGNVGSPVKAALDALRDLRNEVRLVVDHGGVSGESYRRDVHGWYTPLNAFVSIGPPASRIEELIALVEGGIVTVLGPAVQVVPDDDGFVVRSPDVPGSECRAAALIEARLPEPDLDAATDPLLSGLAESGAVTRYAVHGTEGGAYVTGGVAVTRRPYRVVDAEGVAHPARFAFGVPTEGVHWVTAAGIRPGVDSVILGDADAVARAALAAAAAPAHTRVPGPAAEHAAGF